MGNPPILGHCCGGNEPLPTSAPRVHAPVLLWRVYWLRDGGLRLTREAVIKNLRVGRLSVRVAGEPTAILESVGGDFIGQLDVVRIRILLPTGGLLLHGRELGARGSGPRGYPQAWWCELQPP